MEPASNLSINLNLQLYPPNSDKVMASGEITDIFDNLERLCQLPVLETQDKCVLWEIIDSLVEHLKTVDDKNLQYVLCKVLPKVRKIEGLSEPLIQMIDEIEKICQERTSVVQSCIFGENYLPRELSLGILKGCFNPSFYYGKMNKDGKVIEPFGLEVVSCVSKQWNKIATEWKEAWKVKYDNISGRFNGNILDPNLLNHPIQDGGIKSANSPRRYGCLDKKTALEFIINNKLN